MFHGLPTFVMPHYCCDLQRASQLERAIASVILQTDGDWTLVIINDGCANSRCASVILDAVRTNPNKISAIRLPHNRGPGSARNAGVVRAEAMGSEFIM